MSYKTAVVDASVAVKWFVDEQDSDKAMHFLRQAEKLIAPPLIAIEVAGTLTWLCRTKVLRTDSAITLLHKWQSYLNVGIVKLVSEKHLQRASMFSLTLKHPIQDCVYLALAEKLEIPLITADRKFQNKAIAAGHTVIQL